MDIIRRFVYTMNQCKMKLFKKVDYLKHSWKNTYYILKLRWRGHVFLATEQSEHLTVIMIAVWLPINGAKWFACVNFFLHILWERQCYYSQFTNYVSIKHRKAIQLATLIHPLSGGTWIKAICLRVGVWADRRNTNSSLKYCSIPQVCTCRFKVMTCCMFVCDLVKP